MHTVPLSPRSGERAKGEGAFDPAPKFLPFSSPHAPLPLVRFADLSLSPLRGARESAAAPSSTGAGARANPLICKAIPNPA